MSDSGVAKQEGLTGRPVKEVAAAASPSRSLPAWLLLLLGFLPVYLAYGPITGNWTEADRTGSDCDARVVDGTTQLATICTDRGTGETTTTFH
jgi:hypothetical protein